MTRNPATPGLLLVLITLISTLVFVAVALYGSIMPRLGLRLVPGPENDGVFVVDTDPGRVFEPPGIAPYSELIAIGAAPPPEGRPGDWPQPIAVTAGDLVAEPDSLETYAELETFLARQGAFHDILLQDRVELTLRNTATMDVYTVVAYPEGQPLWKLPDGFWVQVLTGIAGVLISGWVWALKPRSLGPSLFLLTGLGLMAATSTSALYANRELAMDPGHFAGMMLINHAGVLVFGLAMVGLLLSYPRQLIHPAWTLAIPILTLAYIAMDAAHQGLGPSQLYIFVAAATLGIIAATMVQFWLARRSPSDRAALGWLGLSIIAGCVAFTILGVGPVLFDTPAGIPQSHVTGVLVVIYIGLALGVSRYRLFELGDWAYRILFYTFGAIVLLALDAALIYLLNVEAAPAFGVSLLFVGFIYLPLRDVIWRRLTAGRRVEQAELFSAALDVAFAPNAAASAQRWRNLLKRLFDPLEIEAIATASDKPSATADGLAMELPAIAGAPALRLTYPFAGRGLFSPSHLRLATNLVSLTERAEEGREAYMRGVGEERRRMARDLHDDVGARLLTGLHTADEATRPTLQAALSDIRAIVSGLAGDEASLDRVLADTRHEAARRLEAAGITLDWPLPETEADAIALDYRLHKALASSVREIVSNTIRHSGADRLDVTIGLDAGRLRLSFADNGKGLPQAALDGETAGYGLRNLRTRIEDVGGHLTLAAGGAGTSIVLDLPLVLVPRPPEPGVPLEAASPSAEA